MSKDLKKKLKMDYELAKKLKDAGLYQDYSDIRGRYYITPQYVVSSRDKDLIRNLYGELPDLSDWVYIPDLEKLLLDMKSFEVNVQLMFLGKKGFTALRETQPIDEAIWYHYPLEAVANLWLELKNAKETNKN